MVRREDGRRKTCSLSFLYPEGEGPGGGWSEGGASDTVIRNDILLLCMSGEFLFWQRDISDKSHTMRNEGVGFGSCRGKKAITWQPGGGAAATVALYCVTDKFC